MKTHIGTCVHPYSFNFVMMRLGESQFNTYVRSAITVPNIFPYLETSSIF